MALVFAAAAISTSAAHAAQPESAAQLTATAPLAARQAWDSALNTGRCATTRDWQALRRSLHLLHLQLQAQGLELRVLQCPQPHALPPSTVWVQIGVLVHDSEVAERFVRGPLAEGELLDLGAANDLASAVDRLAEGVEGGEEDVSPDVHFNRQWLARTMATQGFSSVPGRWWTFAWEANARK